VLTPLNPHADLTEQTARRPPGGSAVWLSGSHEIATAHIVRQHADAYHASYRALGHGAPYGRPGEGG
jgi:hypothetical protein